PLFLPAWNPFLDTGENSEVAANCHDSLNSIGMRARPGAVFAAASHPGSPAELGALRSFRGITAARLRVRRLLWLPAREETAAVREHRRYPDSGPIVQALGLEPDLGLELGVAENSP